MTLSVTVNKAVKLRLTPLPLLMKNHSGGDSAALGVVPSPPHTHTHHTPGISVRVRSSLEKTGRGPSFTTE